MVQSQDNQPQAIPPVGASRCNRWEIAALLAILGLALGLRLFQIDSDWFWLDEMWSMSVAAGHGNAFLEVPEGQIIPAMDYTGYRQRQSWPNIWSSLKGDVHPPLYYLLLRGWMEIFGWTERSATMLSVVFSMAVLLVFWDLCRRLFDPWVALAAVAVMGVSGFQICYAREVKGYMLLQLFMLLGANLLVRIEREKPTARRIVLLMLCVLAAQMTHLLAISFSAALFVYALLRLRGRSRWLVIGAFVGAGIVYLSIWPFSAHGKLEKTQPTRWLTVDGPLSAPWRPLWSISQLPSRFLGHDAMFDHFDRPLRASVLGGAVFLMIPICWRRRKDWQLHSLLILFSVAPIVVLDIAKGMTMNMYTRYMIGAAAPMYIVLLTIFPTGWKRHMVAGTIVLAGLCSYPFAIWPWRDPQRDFAGAARFIDSQRIDSTPTVVVYATRRIQPMLHPEYMQLQVAHYLQRETDYAVLTSPANSELLQAMRAYDHVLIHCWVGDPTDFLPGWRVEKSFGTRSVSAGMVYEMKRLEQP